MIIDSNLYWFDEDIFESEEKMEAFLASAPKQYDTKVHAGTYQTDVRKLSLNVLVSSIENQSQSSISWLGDTLPVTVAAKLIMNCCVHNTDRC